MIQEAAPPPAGGAPRSLALGSWFPHGSSRHAMKLTRASSYAIHTLVFLARQQSPRPTTSEYIAKAQSIPTKFLTKVLKPLVANRMLRTVMGPGGGYQLAKPATQINLLEVIEAV